MTRRNLLALLRRILYTASACLAAWPVLSFITWKKSTVRTVVFTPEEQTDHAFKQGVCLLRENNEIHALSARCTHLCCPVAYSPESRTFRCPCHRSEFDARGIPIRGPAARPLERLKIQLHENGNLEVTVPV